MNYEVRSHVAFFMEPVCPCLDFIILFKKKEKKKMVVIQLLIQFCVFCFSLSGVNVFTPCFPKPHASLLPSPYPLPRPFLYRP